MLLFVSTGPYGYGAEARSPDDALQIETQQAQKRVEQWDEEDRRANKRLAWEFPLGFATMLCAAALVQHDPNFAYAGAGVAVAGLTLHFWPGPHPDETAGVRR